MFIVLGFLLWIIAISLRLTASGLKLAERVYNSRVEREPSDSDLEKAAKVTFSATLKVTAFTLRLVAFIISRVRDLLLTIGSLLDLLGISLYLSIIAAVVGGVVLLYQ